MTKLFDTKWKLLLSGAIIGLMAALLAWFGNPANMAICIACFVRDMAGAMKLHSAAAVQYFRPEIVGFVGGSFLISLATKEFKSTAGSSPLIRFTLGMVMGIGALVFLGCPLRMIIRMAAGDLNAYVGLIGFAGGVLTGAYFLKKGFSLGRNYETSKASGMVLPIVLAGLLVLSVATTLFAVSTEGPGSFHAPILVALIAALIIGAIAQKNRTCFAGAIRDLVLLKDASLLSVIGGIFLIMLIYNVATGNFHLSFAGQPIAHSMHLWNILGLYVVGFAAVLAGGCPFRQLILAGQGSNDSAITFLGLLVGTAMAHNFNLASVAAKAATETEEAVLGGPSIYGKAAIIICIVFLFVVAFVQKRKATKRA